MAIRSGSARSRLARRALARAGAALAVLLALKVAWFLKERPDAQAIASGEARPWLMARREHVLGRALDPSFGPASFRALVAPPFDGEWALVTLSMAGLAEANLARSFPDTRPRASATLEALVERALEPPMHAFDDGMWGKGALSTLDDDLGHVGYLGHLALLLALEADLSPGPPRHHELVAAVLPALRRKLERAGCSLAETYPGERYVPDNAVALAALAIGDRGGEGERFARSRLAALRARYATAETGGLLAFRVDDSCRQQGGARASGAAWSAAYLAHVDRGFARDTHQKLLASFLDRPLPLVWGMREYPRGDDRGGDVDSGPLLLGLSPSATAFAMASARSSGDLATLQRLLDTAEIAGFSWGSREKRYLVAPLLGDAIVLAMVTTVGGG